MNKELLKSILSAIEKAGNTELYNEVSLLINGVEKETPISSVKGYGIDDMRKCWEKSQEAATGTDDFPMGGNTFTYPTFDEYISSLPTIESSVKGEALPSLSEQSTATVPLKHYAALCTLITKKNDEIKKLREELEATKLRCYELNFYEHEYKKTEAANKQPSLPRWVKASERLPDDYTKKYKTRYPMLEGEYQFLNRQEIKELADAEYDIEWLEETEALPSKKEDEDELWKELGRMIYGGISFEWFPEKLQELKQHFTIQPKIS